MALIDATNSGTGKGLITIVVSVSATGRKASPFPAKQEENEWRKSILSKLLEGPSIVNIDNVRGVLESSTLEAMLTGEGVTDRILGFSKNGTAMNEATWMATGNNLLIGGDLPRRCYRIRLISQTAKPEERTDFEIEKLYGEDKDLETWIYENRCQVVTAILTIARAWHVAGKPQPKNLARLGTFDKWARTIGGILEFIGIEGWQQNRDELRSRNNDEAKEWEAFLSVWYEMFGDTWMGATEVAKRIEQEDAQNLAAKQPPELLLSSVLPQYLKKAFAEKPKSFAVTLANQLRKRIQTVYGLDAYRIEKDEDKHNKTMIWRVLRGFTKTSFQTPAEVKQPVEPIYDNLRGVAGVTTNPTHGKNSNNNIADKKSSIGWEKLPQTPANENCEISLNGSNGSTSHFADGEQVEAAGVVAGVSKTEGQNTSQIPVTPLPAEPVDAQQFYQDFITRPNHYLKLRVNGQIAIGIPPEMSDEDFDKIAAIVEQHNDELTAILQEVQ